MFVDWLICCVVVWCLASTLNALLFKKKPAGRLTAWVLTTGLFALSLLALIALQFHRNRTLLEVYGVAATPNFAIAIGGALMLSWMFLSRLRKAGKAKPPFVEGAIERRRESSIDSQQADGEVQPLRPKAGEATKEWPLVNALGRGVDRKRGYLVGLSLLSLVIAGGGYYLFFDRSSTFEDCVLDRMKGQTPSMRTFAIRACAHLPKAGQPPEKLLSDEEIGLPPPKSERGKDSTMFDDLLPSAVPTVKPKSQLRD